MINKIYKHYGKADYNSMMNKGKTLEDIFNEASSYTEYIHIEFQNGVVAYGIAMKDGNIIGAAGNVISYNDAERARFTEEYEQRKAQGKYTTADDFPDSTRYAWERDYVISTLTDILVGGEITAYNMYAVKGADPIVYTDPITIQQALQAATDEANKRIDEFTRIGLKSVPLDSVFFEISEDVNLRKFAETSDVNKLIILASQADANLWEGIMRSGGFKTSEVYARIADDVLSGQLILVDRDGNRLTSEPETEAATDEDEEPVIEAPQYETTEPADNDNNVSTVDRLSVQDGEQSTYNNADANPDAISAPDDEPAQDEVADDEQNVSESVDDDNEIEMDEPDQSDEENTDTDDKPESETVDNTTATEETDTTAEESDETENPTDKVESDDELPKHGDADNDGIANGVDTDPYHADVEPTEDETESESDNADTANIEEPSEPVNADDNTVNTSEDNEHDETSPKTTEFRIPDIGVPTLSTTEFNAVSKNESETEVKNEDELPKHGDADNDGIANAVDADPYNANVVSNEDETEVEPTENEPVNKDSDTAKQDSDTDNTSESDDENEQEDDSESEETTSETETETDTESDEKSDDYSESESEPAPVVESESANANYNAPAYADEKAVALFTTGLDDVDSELDSITDRRASLENTISEQDARIDNIHEVERQIGDMKAKTSRLEGMLDGMKSEADSYNDDVNEAKAELDRLDAREAELGKRSEWLHRAQEVLKQAGLL